MVILITDNDVYYELRNPGVTTIGRGSSNDVVPESRSISKSHALLTLQLTKSSRLEMWIEDLNSTNGTYLGSSPMEVHKILDKEKVIFGDYLRFGHSSQYFRVLESMLPGTALLSEAPQDICSNDSIQDYLDRNEVQSASVYRGEDHEEFEDEFHQDIESSHDRDEDSLHPRQNLKPPSRFSRSTPVPYHSVDGNIRKATEYQRKSAEYPRSAAGREKHFIRSDESHQSEPILFISNTKTKTNTNERKDRGPERFPETSRSLQNRNIEKNVIGTLPIKYPTADNTQQHPISIISETVDPPTIGSNENLWDSPFPISPFPLSPDDGQESQIFPESSPESSSSPQQRFHTNYDCGILSRNISNDPSINHSSIFNTKNYAIPSKKKINDISKNNLSYLINSSTHSNENSTILDGTETETENDNIDTNNDNDNTNNDNDNNNDDILQSNSSESKSKYENKNILHPIKSAAESDNLLQYNNEYKINENRRSDSSKSDKNKKIIDHDKVIHKQSTEVTYDKNDGKDIVLDGRDPRSSNISLKQNKRNSNNSSNKCSSDNLISSDEKNENDNENENENENEYENENENEKNNYSQFFITKNSPKENVLDDDYLYHQHNKSNKNDLKSNYLPVQKNTHDGISMSQDWGLGIGFYKQNENPLYSGNRNSEIKETVYQNLLISNDNLKTFPDTTTNNVKNDQKVGNSIKSMNSSISVSGHKIAKNDNNNNNINNFGNIRKKNYFRDNKIPISENEIKNDIIDQDKFSSLLNDEISKKVAWILGPSSTDWKSSNIKGKLIFYFLSFILS